MRTTDNKVSEMTFEEANEEYRIMRRAKPKEVDFFLDDTFGLKTIEVYNLCDTCIHKPSNTEPKCWICRNEGWSKNRLITKCNFYEER